MSTTNVLVVGAGIFGATAALELSRRGHDVTIVDPGPLPHELAASTDISKVVRMEYGPDERYMELMEAARDGWLAWNQEWVESGRDALYHETGVLMLSQQPMSPGGFEYESWRLLGKRGHRPERLNPSAVAERFPAWKASRYVDGFFHAKGGYAESGRVVMALLDAARQAGARLIEGVRAHSLIEAGGRVSGVRCADGTATQADITIVATGAWAQDLVPHLRASIRGSGHPVFHLRPENAALFTPDRFPTFTADVSQTGYYGFPVNRDGIVKIANHGLGVRLDANAARSITTADERRLRRFLAGTFPVLAQAEIVYTRLCLYADTQDEHFWIAPDPERHGLVVAGGGSGHGFKFAPVLGALIADTVEGRDNPWLDGFAWRPELRMSQGQEAARCHGEEDDPP